MIQPIIDLYTTNYTKVNNATWQVLDGNNLIETNFIPSADPVRSLLIKGGEADYTLVFKDTVNTNVKKSVINNYNVFTNNRLMFNIIAQSENKESVEKNTTTQLSQYLKGE
jgi:hypothetical protein